jgi:hypothetical protein
MSVILVRPLKLEIALDEIVLLEAPQPLADLAGPDRPHPLDGLEIPLGGADDRVEAAQVAHDPADDGLGDPRDVGEHAVPAGLD